MKTWLRCIVAFAAAVAAGGIQAEGYPSKPVRIIIPYTPGGGTEAAGRLLANHLTQVLNQSFVLESRPGGNTVIGTVAVAKAPADGYTVLFTGGSTMSIQPFMYSKPPFDALGEFAPVGMVSRFPFFLASATALPANSLHDLVAMAKAAPGKLSYGSNGSGSIGHLGTEMILHAFGIQMIHVPYKGFAPAVPDLISGRITMMLADVAPIGEQVRAGALKVLAVTSTERSSYWPQVPTVAEQGVPGYQLDVWFALYAPAKTSEDVIRTLNNAMRGYLSSPEAKEAYAKFGMEPVASVPQYVRERIVAEQKVFSKAVKDANLKIE